MNNKQIEEIVDIMLDCDHSFDTCPHSEMGCMRCRAKVILERGFRKIDKGSVVISKEEYKIIDHNFKNLESICTSNEKLIEYWEEQTKIAEEKLTQARKQAVKEFIQAIKKDANITHYDDEVTTFAYVDIDDIYHIAIDKFGVEI